MCCLWQISVHFVFTDFFFLRERHTEASFHLTETLDELPAASSPAGLRRLKCHRVIPGTGHWEWQSHQDAAGHAAISSSSKLLSSLHISTGQWDEGTHLSASAPHISSSPCLSPSPLIGGKFEGPFPGTILFIVWFITRQRHNSGELGKMLGFFYHFRNQLRK